MKIKVISYGYKFYEEQGLMPPKHDFLFNLRDLNNPFWVPELKPYSGKDSRIHDFFLKDESVQKRLGLVTQLSIDFVQDFLANPGRNASDEMTIAFRCTGGKHRSVYFAEKVYESLETRYQGDLSIEIEHVDLAKHGLSSC